MKDKQQLRATLAALKDLKSEYYIGSKAAFSYLKAVRWYEHIRREIISKDPQDHLRQKLTVQHIDWLINAIRSLTKMTLQCISIQTSTPENWSCLCDHEVQLPAELAYVDLPYGITKYGNNYGNFSYHWSIDYLSVLDQFLCLAVKLNNFSLENFDTAETALSIFFVSLSESKNGHKCLTFLSTQETISFSEFAEKAQYRTMDSNEWLGAANAHLASGTIPEELSIRSELDQSEIDTISLLRKAYEEEDSIAAHDILSRMRLEDIEIETDYYRGERERRHIVKSCLSESCLYGQAAIFKRAENEYTLGHREIERRVILNTVHNHYLHPNQFASLEEFIDELINHYRTMLQKSERLTDDLLSKGEGFVAAMQQKASRHLRYVMLSIIQNRKWLIKFLSN